VEAMSLTNVCTDYGRRVEIEIVRYFVATKMTLGVGFDERSWFVYDRQDGESWHCHCGPYSTADQGRWWINEIRETAGARR
jgi:hypothetical protein